VAEHLGALLVFTAAVSWLVTIGSYYQQAVAPAQTQASAYHAANVVVVTGQKTVTLGATQWHVTVSDTQIEVFKGETTTPTLVVRHDAD
jgi:hypothetical protein